MRKVVIERLGDADLLQELLIEICRVDRFERITDGLVKIRLTRRRLMYWRGWALPAETDSRRSRGGYVRSSGDMSAPEGHVGC